MPHDRTRLTMHHDPQYYRIRNHLVDFLVTRSKAMQVSSNAQLKRLEPVEVTPGLSEQDQPFEKQA